MNTPAHDTATRALEVAGREYRTSRFRVTVMSGPNTGLSAESSRSELAIGSAPGNDLILSDASVSRHHCTFLATQSGVHLRDLRSTNGTWIGPVRIDSALLPASASVRVGETTIRFDVLDDQLREPLSDEERFGKVIGRSAAMRRLFALLPRVAQSDATILLEGETGTGKGLLADAIHGASERARGPMIVVDCGAIPPSLIESELFGHERGAFTGATTGRVGAFEAASGGTIFLDEIGELPLEMQPKLLRALEERTIKRIGSVEPIKLDVRVIAATNRDLRQEINRGAFRADLYFRLNTVCVQVPALRDRREDIPELVRHFYAQFARVPDAAPPAQMVAAFVRRDWPGNVRELRSAVERMVLLGDGDAYASESRSTAITIGAASVPEPPTIETPAVFDPGAPFKVLKERMVSAWERAYLEELVRRYGTNLSRAARAARTDRNYLRDLLRRHAMLVVEE